VREGQRTIRVLPAERLQQGLVRKRPLPDRLPDDDRRTVLRVPQRRTSASIAMTTPSPRSLPVRG
jgi:hypothetical protein